MSDCNPLKEIVVYKLLSNINIKQTIRQNILNIPGWHTNRHIVVIESDD